MIAGLLMGDWASTLILLVVSTWGLATTLYLILLMRTRNHELQEWHRTLLMAMGMEASRTIHPTIGPALLQQTAKLNPTQETENSTLPGPKKPSGGVKIRHGVGTGVGGGG